MAQENRSLDTYFGQLPAYWAANGFPAQQFDGMPTGASNPGFNGAPPVSDFHLATECVENLTPSWDESHLDWNLNDPTSSTATLDGFVYNAAKFGQDEGYFDTAGIRSMGYYDWTDLNYYYFMASNFATSDAGFPRCWIGPRSTACICSPRLHRGTSIRLEPTQPTMLP